MGWRAKDVQLRCGQCETTFARVHIRALYPTIFAWTLGNGAKIMPRPGYSVNEESRQRVLRAAESEDPMLIESARRVEAYLHRVAGEIIFDLRCLCGLRYVRSMPDLRREVRDTEGDCTILSPNLATWHP